MSVESPEYAALHDDAAKQPIKLIDARLGLGGHKQGGLTLTREHIITLQDYADYALALPNGEGPTAHRLGYFSISEPELMPQSMAQLFEQLRQHGRSWLDLADNNKTLASELAITALNLHETGSFVLEECNRIRQEGGANLTWKDIELMTPVELTTSEKTAVLQLGQYFEALRQEVADYSAKVELVVEGNNVFRTELVENLIPSVNRKRQAVRRKIADDDLGSLRQRLAELDSTIEAHNKQYDQYLGLALGGLAAGPLGVAITGGIYGAKAEGVRKERNKAQAERRQVSCEIKRAIKLEGAMEELSSFVDQLKSRLNEVRTAANHLDTAWGSVFAYIQASIKKLDSIGTTRQLAMFIFHFRTFLRQWKEIEEKAQQLTTIFDEAHVQGSK